MRTASYRIIFPLVAVVLLGCAGIARAQEQAAPSLVLSGPMQVGKVVSATFDLGGKTVPQGQFVSVNVRVLSKPESAHPQFRSGYPVTEMTFDVPGDYTLEFVLSSIGKSSCAAVKAAPLLEQKEQLVIAPAP